MKKLHPSYWPLLSLLLVPNVINAQPRFSLVDEWMQRQVVMPEPVGTLDDFLIAFSKAASANILADVTEFEPDASIATPQAGTGDAPQPLPPLLYLMVTDFASKANLAVDRTEGGTLVHWRNPDTQRLLELVAAHRKALETANPPQDPQTTVAALEKWHEERIAAAGETGEHAAGNDVRIPLAALPPEIRGPLEAEVFERVARLISTPDFHALEPSFWKKARFNLGKSMAARRDANGQPNKAGLEPLLTLTSAGPNPARLDVGLPHLGIRIPSETLVRKRQPGGAPTAQSKPSKAVRALVPMASAPPARLDQMNLGEEPGLEKHVSFDSKRQPLIQFLGDLSRQSGVALQSPEGPLSQRLLTVHSTGMRLSDTMSALGRIYQAHWTKEGTTYSLVPDQLDEMQRLLAHEGIFVHYGIPSGSGSTDRDELGAEVADEVMGHFELDQLKSRTGAPFSALPAETQERVLALFRSDATSPLIMAQQRIEDVRAQELELRFSPVKPGSPMLFGVHGTRGINLSGVRNSGASIFAVYSADGRFITQIFDNFL